MDDLRAFDDLTQILQSAKSVLVAFSGGVDSTFLAAVAHDVLGARAVALTAASPALPPESLDEARRLASDIESATSSSPPTR